MIIITDDDEELRRRQHLNLVEKFVLRVGMRGLRPYLESVSRARNSRNLYGPFSGVIIPSVSHETRGFKSSNFTVILLLVILKIS